MLHEISGGAVVSTVLYEPSNLSLIPVYGEHQWRVMSERVRRTHFINLNGHLGETKSDNSQDPKASFSSGQIVLRLFLVQISLQVL